MARLNRAGFDRDTLLPRWESISQKLLDHGMDGSIGRVGTTHDNALMESTVGLYNSEPIRSGRRSR